jgi:hypothetical protein
MSIFHKSERGSYWSMRGVLLYFKLSEFYFWVLVLQLVLFL